MIWILLAIVALQLVALIAVIGRMAHLNRKVQVLAEILDLAPCYRVAVLRHAANSGALGPLASVVLRASEVQPESAAPPRSDRGLN